MTSPAPTLTTAPFFDMLTFFAKSITRYAAIKTTDNSTGDESFTYAAAQTISGALYKRSQSYTQDKEGLFDDADAIVLVKPDVTITKNDKLVYNGDTFRVSPKDDVVTRKLGETAYYKVFKLFNLE
jgi:hypothetical protein